MRLKFYVVIPDICLVRHHLLVRDAKLPEMIALARYSKHELGFRSAILTWSEV